MRKINMIIWHCTATPEGKDFTVDDIRRWHVNGNGWQDIGYHFVVYRDGTVHLGRPIEKAGAHVKNNNANSIGCVYIGGCDSTGKKAKDTRTDAQKKAMVELTKELLKQYPNCTVHGHNEFDNKACPCFDVKEWVKDNKII